VRSEIDLQILNMYSQLLKNHVGHSQKNGNNKTAGFQKKYSHSLIFVGKYRKQLNLQITNLCLQITNQLLRKLELKT